MQTISLNCLALLLIGLGIGSDGHSKRHLGLDDLWHDFKTKFQKSYEYAEEPLRRNIWEENVKFIQRHNLEYDLGHHTFTVGINEYADLTAKEYSKYLLGFRPSAENFHQTRHPEYFVHKPSEVLPKNLDWRKYGYVTPVKNQGQCGSCWAFSSTGSLEGQHFRKYGRLVSLSEQNLVDCSNTFGNAGCNGGWMMNAFKYIHHNDGIDTETSYPYEARDDTCRYKREDRGADDTGYVMIPKADETALKAAVAKVGPVSVAIDAAHQSFQLYRSGVYVEPKCSHNATDHAVLVVGYGVYQNSSSASDSHRPRHDKNLLLKHKITDGGQDYWLVKNSWGESWGMNGYIMMGRNMDNQCAIASFACYPTE